MNQRVPRHVKVAAAIKKELGQIIQSGGIKDDRMAALVSIVDVDVAPNLAHARISYSVVDSDNQMASEIGTQAALESHAGRLRGLIARRLNLRYAPGMVFVCSDSLKKGSDIIDLINEVTEEREEREEGV